MMLECCFLQCSAAKVALQSRNPGAGRKVVKGKYTFDAAGGKGNPRGKKGYHCQAAIGSSLLG